MARNRTCFASSVCFSEDFLGLSPEAQALYYHLGFVADSDGFVEAIRREARFLGVSDDAVTALIEAGFILPVGGIHVITHWLVNNRTDRRNYRPGAHAYDLLPLLDVEDNKPYALKVCHQSDVSLSADVNTIQNNTIRYDPIQKNPNEEKEIQTPETLKNSLCPECGHDAIASSDPMDNRVVDCPHCHRVTTINPDGEIIDMREYG